MNTTELRLQIDKIINSFGVLPNQRKSREISLSFTNLQRAKMWLGKTLEALGRDNPYPKSDDPISPVIEPQADHTPVGMDIPLGMDEVAMVKLFRSEIQKVMDEYKWGSDSIPTAAARFYDESYMAICESKMWLGMELNRIREIEESKKTTDKIEALSAEVVNKKAAIETGYYPNGDWYAKRTMANGRFHIEQIYGATEDRKSSAIQKLVAMPEETEPIPAAPITEETPTINRLEAKETGKLLNFGDFGQYSDTIIESGSGMGGGIEQMLAAGYKRIKSVEAKDTYHAHNQQKFAEYPQVHLYFGMSKDRFHEMISDIDSSAVFFLDAHVSGPSSAGHEDYMEKGNASEYAQDNCLTEELRIILAHRSDHVIIIDDQNGENPENMKYREMCLAVNSNYKFLFYDEQRGETFYKNKSLVAIPSTPETSL